MRNYQSFNQKIGRWVKYSKSDGKTKITDVKQRMPKKKFKGVPVRSR